MNNRPIDREKLTDAVLSSAGGRLTRAEINQAKSGDLSGLMAALTPEDREKLQKALSDKSALAQILSGDAARKILEQLSGGKKNG